MSNIEISCPHCGALYRSQDAQPRCPGCGKTPDEPVVAGMPTVPPVPTGATPEMPMAPEPLGLAPTPPPPPPPQSYFPPPTQQYPGYGAPPAGTNPIMALLLGWWNHVKRALVSDSRQIQLLSDEEPALAARGVLDPAAQRHFAWRRSLLWLIVVPATFTALFGFIDFFASTDFKAMTSFGVFVMLLYALSLWGVPAASFFAARFWDQPRKSRLFLLGGFAVSFLFLFVVGLLPGSWMFQFPEGVQERLAAAVIVGLAMFFQLLPAILSLLPGLMRACVRQKVLFPQSTVSGWVLVVVTPIYALFLLTLFILFNQVASNILLLLGAAALVIAPGVYIWRMQLFVKPLWTDEDRLRLSQVQHYYLIAVASGVALILVYLMTGKIAGRFIMGGEQALIGFWRFLWEIIQFGINYIGRTLFITAIAVEGILLMNVQSWRTTREFEQNPVAGEFENTINDLNNSLQQ